MTEVHEHVSNSEMELIPEMKGFCSSVVFIPRSVVDEKPIIVKLSASEMKNLVLNKNSLEESGDDSDNEDDKKDEEMDCGNNDNENAMKGGDTIGDEDEKAAEKYKMNEYDDAAAPLLISGISKFKEDDPYLKNPEEEDPEDLEDLEVRENENIVAYVINDLDDSEVVYTNFNHVTFHNYVRTSNFLHKCPLVIKYVHPESDAKEGNLTLVAIGFYEPIIELWDVNMINSAGPVITLGKELSKKQRKSKENFNSTHVDAVTTLSWNQNMPHILASGSIDKRVILWDITSESVGTLYDFFKEEIQFVLWHPIEVGILLVATATNNIYAINCSTDMTGEEAVNFKIDDDHTLESLDWDRQNPFIFYASSTQGFIYTFDSRKKGKYQHVTKSHESSTNVLLCSRKIEGMVLSAGEGNVIIWKADSNGSLTKIYEVKSLVGTIFSADFCPENPNVVVFAGNEGERLQFCDLSTFDEIVKAFS
uniref:WD_REPEATS_REGION domain-containing protein n=1 Tax=Strongyloides papillosus TaxID=174720 RepID=A0A0N5BF61_STREA